MSTPTDSTRPLLPFRPVRPLRGRVVSGSEAASITVVAAAVITVLAVVSLFVLRVAIATSERARAQNAADSAALAGAAQGQAAAEDLARRNGAVIESYAEAGNDVTVVVSFGSATANATARQSDPGASFVDLTGTAPDTAPDEGPVGSPGSGGVGSPDQPIVLTPPTSSSSTSSSTSLSIGPGAG